MRRWLTLLLLVLLPAQFTWGAAAAYCQHEVATQTRHFGHHLHAHAETSQQASPHKASADNPPKGKIGLDDDCGVCHLSAVKPVSDLSLWLVPPPGQCMDSCTDPRFSTRAPDHPERPKWRIA